MLRLAKCLTLALLALCAVTTTTTIVSAQENMSLRGACEAKCATRKGACSIDCEEAMGMALDQSFVTTCQTECAREKEYCVAGCSVLITA